MTWFANLRIGMKLMIGFGLAVALMLFVFWTGYSGANELGRNIKSLKDDALAGTNAIAKCRFHNTDGRRLRVSIFAARDQKTMESEIAAVKKSNEDLQEALKAYQATIVAKEDQDLFDAYKAAHDEYGKLEATMFQLLEQGKKKEAQDLFEGEMRQLAREKVAPAMDKVFEYNLKNGENIAKRSFAAVDSVKSKSLITVVVALFVVIAFCTVITRMISKAVAAVIDRMGTLEKNGLTNLGHAMQCLKEGDLTYGFDVVTKPIPNPAKDEIGQISATFNEMLEKIVTIIYAYNDTRQSLAAMIAELQDNASTVAATSQQLTSSAADTNQVTVSITESINQVASAIEEAARSSQQIAKGSEQLASTATDAAAAMEKLHESINEVKKGSEVQSEAVSETSANIKVGTKAVDGTVASMQRIQSQVQKSAEAVKELGEKGQQIGEIVQTIEDIAQQTNLLALNAAIEAARAGEQGKGFAVVADEVRKLAERSALATQEIAQLIASVRDGVDQAVKAMDASTSEVEEGASRSKEAGEALQQIITATEKVTAAAEANRSAVELMMKGAEQVAMAITTAASVSEENAASAEELSAGTQQIYASTEQVTSAAAEASASVESVTEAAKELSQMAENLNEIVARFKVETTQSTKRQPSLRVA